MKRRVILLGPPASGKGTQAQKLVARFGMPAGSTGAMLRQERAENTDLGREADRWTSEGHFFPDELALKVVRRWLDAGRWDGFILDGFPRAVGQARIFDEMLTERSAGLDAVVSLTISDDEIRHRVLDRLTCPNCGSTFTQSAHGLSAGDACENCQVPLERRSDDKLDVLERRLAQHNENTVPVLDYYRMTGRLAELNANGPSAEVFSELCGIIEGVTV